MKRRAHWEYISLKGDTTQKANPPYGLIGDGYFEELPYRPGDDRKRETDRDTDRERYTGRRTDEQVGRQTDRYRGIWGRYGLRFRDDGESNGKKRGKCGAHFLEVCRPCNVDASQGSKGFRGIV